MNSTETCTLAFKIAAIIGGGKKPGYQWDVIIMNQARTDSKQFLSEAQYRHLANQVKELARHKEPTRSDSVDIRSIEDFYEIRDKGSILGKINARIFLFCDKETRSIVVLGAMKKENEGSIAPGDKIKMRRRMRLFFQDHARLRRSVIMD